MTMTRQHGMHLVAVALVVTAGLAAVAPAAVAQEAVPGANDTDDNSSAEIQIGVEGEDEQTGERVDNDTVILSSSYDAGTGEATVTLRSSRPQQITLTDAGGFIEGGEVTRRRTVLPEGKSKISIPATKADGYVIIGVATSETLYAEKVSARTRLFGGDAEWNYVWLTAGISLLGSAGIVLYSSRQYIESDDPEIAERIL